MTEKEGDEILSDMPSAEMIDDETFKVPYGEQKIRTTSYDQEKIPVRLHGEFFQFISLMLKQGKGEDYDKEQMTKYRRKFARFAVKR